ncbi:hypothetical protein HDK77DRAFT_256339 [Phyllosticta capitalensis]
MKEMDEWERAKARKKAEADAYAARCGEHEKDEEEEEEVVVVLAESSKMGAAREGACEQEEEKEAACDERRESHEPDKPDLHHTSGGDASADVSNCNRSSDTDTATDTDKSPNALIQQLPRFKQTARKSTGIPQGDDDVDDDADDDGHCDDPYGGRARKRRRGAGGCDQDGDEDASDGFDGQDEGSDADDANAVDWDQFDTVTITRRGVSRSFRLVPIDDEEELDDGYSRRRAGQNSFPPSRPAAASCSSASAPGTRQTARKVPSSYQCDGAGDGGEDDGESDDSESDSDSDDVMEEEDNTTQHQHQLTMRKSSGGPYLMAKHVMAAKKTGSELLPHFLRPQLASRLAPQQQQQQQQQQRSSVFRFDGEVLTSTPAYVPTAADGARKTASSTSPPTSSSSVPGEHNRGGYMPDERREINARRDAAGLPRLQTARKRTGARAPVGLVDDEEDAEDAEDEDDEDEEGEEDETDRIVLWMRDGSGRGYRPERE